MSIYFTVTLSKMLATASIIQNHGIEHSQVYRRFIGYAAILNRAVRGETGETSPDPPSRPAAQHRCGTQSAGHNLGFAKGTEKKKDECNDIFLPEGDSHGFTHRET